MEKLCSQALKLKMLENVIGIVELSRITKISHSMLGKHLKRDLPVRLPTLAKLAKALNCDWDELIVKDVR